VSAGAPPVLSDEDRDVVCHELASEVGAALDPVLAELASLRKRVGADADSADAALGGVLARQLGYLHEAREGLDIVAERPLRVVLMGRTQAGKSTLYCALTGAPRSLIGQGAQATTREVHSAPALDLSHVEVFDTPGVGAQDRPQDRETALDQARQADVVLWVCTNDSFQKVEQQALDEVLDWGTPVVLVLTCLQALGSEAKARKFADAVDDHPVQVMERDSGHLARPRRALQSRAQAAVVEVPVHALAYLEALDTPDRDLSRGLRAASNLDALLAVLTEQSVELRHLRRATATADHVRALLSELSGVAVEAARQAGVAADITVKASAEAEQYVTSALETGRASWLLAVDQRLAGFGSWSDDHYRDSDDEIRKALSADLTSARDDLLQQLRSEARALNRKITERLRRSARSWERVQGEAISVDLPRRGLPHRLRAAAPDLLLIGIGIAAIPFGAPIAAAVGVGLAIARFAGIDKLLARVFGTGARRKALQQRRVDVQKAVDQEVAKLQRRLAQQWDRHVSVAWQHVVEQHVRELRKAGGRQRRHAVVLRALARSCESTVTSLDRNLVSALARLEGDRRLTADLGVYRRPGVVLAVEVPDLTVARRERTGHHPYLRGASFVPAPGTCEDSLRLALLCRPSQDRPWRVRRTPAGFAVVAPRPALVPLAEALASAGSSLLGVPVAAARSGGAR